MTFCSGKAFPAWGGNILSGTMGLRHLNRIVLAGDSGFKEARLLLPFKWRVRLLSEGPDGLLYLGLDDGLIVRLRPAR